MPTDSTDLVVIAISFAIAVTPVVIGYVLTRRADADNERKRTERDEASRRRHQGEEAAGQIMDEINRAELAFFSSFGRKIKIPYEPPEAKQRDLEATYFLVRRKALSIPDEKIASFARQLADAIYWCSDAAYERRVYPVTVWREIRSDAEAVFGAYIRGEPPPEPAHLAKIIEDLESHQAWVAEQLREDEEGPPDADSATDAASTEG